MPNQFTIPAIAAGTIFGRLTVVKKAMSRKVGKRTRGMYLCQYTCGNTVSVLSNSLKLGWSKSCGCLKRELGVGIKSHGESIELTKEYRTWCHIKSRCYIPSAKGYMNYGGRGIKVCDKWLTSFENFLADMGRAPSESHTINRNNNDLGYEPGNCRWATRLEQARNTRRSKHFNFNGKSMLLDQWAKEVGIGRTTLVARIMCYGWTTEKALTTPVNKQFSSPVNKTTPEENPKLYG